MAAQRERRMSIAERRISLVGSNHSIEADELREQREQRAQRSAAVVARAIRAREEEAGLPRPLKRFGTPLSIMLLHHTFEDANARVQRRMVVMNDSLRWPAFPSWLEGCLGLPKGGAKDKIVQYFDEQGRSRRLEGMRSLLEWLDGHWLDHPPELHVYDMQSLVQDAEDRMSTVASIFEDHDADASGTMCVAELRDMMLALDVASDLNVSRDDLANFVSLQFAAADLDDDGQLTFDEFAGLYNSLQDYLRGKLTHHARHTQAYLRFREMACEARSFKRTLQEVVELGGGKLPLDCSESGAADVCRPGRPGRPEEAGRAWPVT